VKKAEDLISVIEKELGLSSDMKTSKDMLFTLEIVACLGACGIAPVVVVDEQVYGSMTPQKVKDLIANIRLEESKHAK
jgi:NADH-quinone oxidoreductase subunit E